MEYQILKNLTDSQSSQPSKFRTKSCVERNDDRRGRYDKKPLKLRLQS